MDRPIPRFNIGDRVLHKRSQKISKVVDRELLPPEVLPVIRVTENGVENDITTYTYRWLYQCSDTKIKHFEEVLDFAPNYRIFLKLDKLDCPSPLHFLTTGIPTTKPYPNAYKLQDGEVLITWQIDIEALSYSEKREVLFAIVRNTNSNAEELSSDGYFGVNTQWVDRFTGDEFNYSITDREEIGKRRITLDRLSCLEIDIEMEFKVGLLLINLLPDLSSLLNLSSVRSINKIISSLQQQFKSCNFNVRWFQDEENQEIYGKMFEVLRDTSLNLCIFGDEAFILLEALAIYKIAAFKFIQGTKLTCQIDRIIESISEILLSLTKCPIAIQLIKSLLSTPYPL